MSIQEGDEGTVNAVFSVTRSGDSSQISTVEFATADGTATVSDNDYSPSSDRLVFNPGETVQYVAVAVHGEEAVEGDETFLVVLSDAAGGTIADDRATGTIVNDDFETPEGRSLFVVDDGTPDETYRYAEGGELQTRFRLADGNSRPRGAEADAAGTRLWVVDDSGKVYVYQSDGTPLGSWTLNALVALEGIATDEVDIWIVESFWDKVYRYSNAASRTSGAQDADFSFALAAGNRSPAGITTDGTHLWIVDDMAKAVFQYSVGGSLLGSWMIDSAQIWPSGSALDPAGESQSLWIVDSFRDQVFEYAGALGRTSGAQAADRVFALAAGNSNPQGLADPPASRPLEIASGRSTAPTAATAGWPYDPDSPSPGSGVPMPASVAPDPAASPIAFERWELSTKNAGTRAIAAPAGVPGGATTSPAASVFPTPAHVHAVHVHAGFGQPMPRVPVTGRAGVGRTATASDADVGLLDLEPGLLRILARDVRQEGERDLQAVVAALFDGTDPVWW